MQTRQPHKIPITLNTFILYCLFKTPGLCKQHKSNLWSWRSAVNIEPVYSSFVKLWQPMTQYRGVVRETASLATSSGLIVIMWQADATKRWKKHTGERKDMCFLCVCVLCVFFFVCLCVCMREQRWWVRGGWFWHNPPTPPSLSPSLPTVLCLHGCSGY